MSVHVCDGCQQGYCDQCDEISECPLCGSVFCGQCMEAHTDDNSDCMKAARVEAKTLAREDED